MIFITLHDSAKHVGMRQYFDINRMMKLRDKFSEPGVIQLLETVVEKLILISEQVNSREFLYKSKSLLVE